MYTHTLHHLPHHYTTHTPHYTTYTPHYTTHTPHYTTHTPHYTTYTQVAREKRVSKARALVKAEDERAAREAKEMEKMTKKQVCSVV
jgi:hypothetical protein